MLAARRLKDESEFADVEGIETIEHFPAPSKPSEAHDLVGDADCSEHLEMAKNHEPSPPPHKMRSSASSPGDLGSSRSSMRSRGHSRSAAWLSSPLRQKPPFQPPTLDKFGCSTIRLKLAKHPTTWDERHQLLIDEQGDPMADNGVLPRGRRRYFSACQDHDDLKAHLESQMTLGQKSLRSVRCALDGPETPRREQPFVTADVGPPILPERHCFGGTMKDVDDKVRPWNDRWHRDMAQLNDGLHKSHRQYFAQDSLFKVSASQRWRRYNDQQVGPGQWMPMSTKKKQLFPPLGG